jgi:hypothetical protein
VFSPQHNKTKQETAIVTHTQKQGREIAVAGQQQVPFTEVFSTYISLCELHLPLSSNINIETARKYKEPRDMVVGRIFRLKSILESHHKQLG